MALGGGFAWASFTGQTRPLVLGALWAFGWWVWSMRGRWTPSGRFGAANAVTAIRLGLAFAMLWLPLAWRVPGAGLLLMAFFALDGLDGRLARRSGQSSAFGAAFDMETDACMTSLACLTAVDVGVAGRWLLWVGGMRFAFVVLTHKLDSAPEPPRSTARWSFSLLMVSLTASLVVRLSLFDWVAALAGLAVLFSFAQSFVWAITHRR